MDIEKLKEVISGLEEVQDRYIRDLEKRIEELSTLLEATQQENDNLRKQVEELSKRIEIDLPKPQPPTPINPWNPNEWNTPQPYTWKISDNTGATWSDNTLGSYTTASDYNEKLTKVKNDFYKAMKDFEEGYKDD